MCVNVIVKYFNIIFTYSLFYTFFIKFWNNLNLQILNFFLQTRWFMFAVEQQTTLSPCIFMSTMKLWFFVRWCWSWLRWLGRMWSSMIWYYSSCGRCSCAHGTCTTAPCVLSCWCPFMTSTSVRSVQSTPVTRCGTSFPSVLGNTPFQLQHNCHNSPFVGSFHFKVVQNDLNNCYKNSYRSWTLSESQTLKQLHVYD